jgi:hypothetical protein
VTARDDYPAVAVLADAAEGRDRTPEAVRMFHEIERLRRWKAEASEVLARWDTVAERFDLSGHLGEFMADAVADEIDRLRREVREWRMLAETGPRDEGRP